MRHPYRDVARSWSVHDRDCATNTRHDIEWDDHRWNSRASSSLSYSEDLPLPARSNDEENRPGLRLRPHPRLRAGGWDVRHLILHRQTCMPNVDTRGLIRGGKFSQSDWQYFTEDYQRSFGEPG
jgi:hypothetical protein